MAIELINESIRDTDTHTFPAHTVTEYGQSVYQYNNHLDAEVTVEAYGTYDADDSWQDEVLLGSFTASANSGGRDEISDVIDKMRLKVTASSQPSSGNFVLHEHFNK